MKDYIHRLLYRPISQLRQDATSHQSTLAPLLDTEYELRIVLIINQIKHLLS